MRTHAELSTALHEIAQRVLDQRLVVRHLAVRRYAESRRDEVDLALYRAQQDLLSIADDLSELKSIHGTRPLHEVR